MTDISNNIALKGNNETGYELGGEMYLFHQTPPLLGKDLMQFVPLVAGDSCYEPFAGEGAFYNAFPSFVSSDWSEITRGRDYKDYKGSYSVVITNPPFRVPNEKGVLKNAIYPLLLYFAERATKCIAFLVSEYAFASLTPVRIAKMASFGFFLHSITTCAVKSWKGRYYFLIWMKEPSNFLTCLQGTY
jgi:hypothetical protein